MKEKAKTYGETISPDGYSKELEVHQYIPQADALIYDEIERFATEKQRPIRILDLGMGPGRITTKMAGIKNSHVVGIDNSKPFVEVARKNNDAPNVEYVLSDFLQFEPDKKFDVIFMQGVWHHVPLELRPQWLEKARALLVDDGVLIVGDEVIPAYENEGERQARVGLFYLHIIGQAIKSQSFSLAKNECINFLADTLSGEKARYDDALISYIQTWAVYIDSRLFALDSTRLTGDQAALLMIEIISEARRRSFALIAANTGEVVERGDYKVSIPVLDTQLERHFKRRNRRDSGPVDHVGGMSVLTYVKA